MSCTVPVSLFTAWTLRSAVSLVSARSAVSGEMRPFVSLNSSVTVKPKRCSLLAGRRTEECSLSATTIRRFPEARAAMLSAQLLLSVPPEVKMTLSRETPSSSAMASRLSRRILRGAAAALCREEGLPYKERSSSAARSAAAGIIGADAA